MLVSRTPNISYSKPFINENFLKLPWIEMSCFPTSILNPRLTVVPSMLQTQWPSTNANCFLVPQAEWLICRRQLDSELAKQEKQILFTTNTMDDNCIDLAHFSMEQK